MTLTDCAFRLPKQQQDSISTWVIENVLSKSRPVFVISSAGELLCYDMERHSPTWVNCSFRYKFDGKPRTITLKVNGISVEFSLPKSAELAIRECFRHDGINFCWCDTVCVNIVYMVTGDRELTKPMLSSMGETYLRAPTCVLETALRDDLFYTRSWTIQECLLSKPLQVAPPDRLRRIGNVRCFPKPAVHVGHSARVQLGAVRDGRSL